jgi:hypothetical protein
MLVSNDRPLGPTSSVLLLTPHRRNPLWPRLLLCVCGKERRLSVAVSVR